ncbi:Uncharacterised protein [Streptococcus porcinus]|uniref:hypothetical protein n=1 Tax=Streptococcus porcinus TaxID=1340 RepID=UPI0010CACA4D|nr:hypothetical protein [Streptococcus porcinus]VTS33273.1 Uncharacterised protein [Streptococcus porcinus]
MNRLSPKPNNRESRHYTWQDLDEYLLSVFSSLNEENYANIDPRDYDIPKDELLSELKKAGYSVLESGHNLEIR